MMRKSKKITLKNESTKNERYTHTCTAIGREREAKISTHFFLPHSKHVETFPEHTKKEKLFATTERKNQIK